MYSKNSLPLALATMTSVASVASAVTIYSNDFSTAVMADPFIEGDALVYDSTLQAVSGVAGEQGFGADTGSLAIVPSSQGTFIIDFVFGNREDSSAFFSFVNSGGRIFTFGNVTNNEASFGVGGPLFNRYTTPAIAGFPALDTEVGFYSLRLVFSTVTGDGEVFTAPLASFDPGADNFDEGALVSAGEFNFDTVFDATAITGIALTSSGPGAAETVFDDININFEPVPEPSATALLALVYGVSFLRRIR